MTHIPLLDLDQMITGSGETLSTFYETVDLSAHVIAEAMSDVWHMTPLQGKDGFGRAQGDLWMVDDWSFSELNLPPALFHLDTHHVQDIGSHILIERWVSGQERGIREDGHCFQTQPGTIEFFYQEVAVKTFCSQRCIQDISLPRELLGFPADEPFEVPEITRASTIGQLVFDEWDDVFADLKSGSGQVASMKLKRLVACLKIAIGVHPQREDVRLYARHAVFRQICRFIEQNLEDPDLCADTLLDAFGVSRATLYRMFEPLGGVQAYLTHRRAASALYYISLNEGRRGFVKAACERWGFSSPTNFNRTVQRLFGNSPKALLLDRNNPDPASGSLSHFVQNYLDASFDGFTASMPAFAT